MRALDLYCGGGGASMGLSQAGFKEIVGIDILPQKYYPFEFKEEDALRLPKEFLQQFDFIWASPPCQAYSIGTTKYRAQGKTYPDLISATRDMLLESGKPFVIENVPGAPIRKDLLLCGGMFSLKIVRHRWFEIHNFECNQPKHNKHKGSVCDGTLLPIWTGGTPGCFGDKEKRKRLKEKLKSITLEDKKRAMGIDWINELYPLAQTVPPAYSKYIGEQFLKGRT